MNNALKVLECLIRLYFFGFSLTFYVACAKCLCLGLESETGFIPPKTSRDRLLSFDGVAHPILAILLVGIDQGISNFYLPWTCEESARFVFF